MIKISVIKILKEFQYNIVVGGVNEGLKKINIATYLAIIRATAGKNMLLVDANGSEDFNRLHGAK